MSNMVESPLPTGTPRLERIVHPLYDSANLHTALPTTELFFFKNPVGDGESGGGAGAAASKGYLHTNMEISGALPAPRIFNLWGIGIVVDPFHSGDLALGNPDPFTPLHVLEDYKRIVNYSVVRLWIGTKDYINIPSHQCPSPYGARGVAVHDDSIATGAVQIPAQWFSGAGKRYSIQPESKVIYPNQTFGLTMYWSTAAAAFALDGLDTPGPLSGPRRIWWNLFGEHGREVQ